MTAALQVAFLTGQSRPPACALSPRQQRFIVRLAAATGAIAVDRNFPYAVPTVPWRHTPLLRASVSNGWQYLSAQGSAFRAQHRASVIALVARAGRTVFLAGSCGLELLRRLDLPADLLERVSFVAHGPVARRRPACQGIVVQGSRDWMSRVLSSWPDHRIACGHLDYLESEAFAQICADFVRVQREPLAVTHAAAL